MSPRRALPDRKGGTCCQSGGWHVLRPRTFERSSPDSGRSCGCNWYKHTGQWHQLTNCIVNNRIIRTVKVIKRKHIDIDDITKHWSQYMIRVASCSSLPQNCLHGHINNKIVTEQLARAGFSYNGRRDHALNGHYITDIHACTTYLQWSIIQNWLAFQKIPQISTEPKNHTFRSGLPQPEPLREEIPKSQARRKTKQPLTEVSR